VYCNPAHPDRPVLDRGEPASDSSALLRGVVSVALLMWGLLRVLGALRDGRHAANPGSVSRKEQNEELETGPGVSLSLNQ
jgi:hypothetical protein